ncbi:metalloregulator ArsR/SmtB family transcription factor [Clostridium sp. SYSU_GA19001]|uniref:ArsR/SmtB family transcription factor n=1 Tax=Clostridium caldaquaticum TaxID=2940653 RepID=UPI0020774B29|nr:metalloregulator ArsR/SmtB family transcription factor [Clostridium caldaquaticum]MCM8709427.1 metalloregulator ArsR/SmtB family transcription factor [Clostridium caldaquaticum]
MNKLTDFFKILSDETRLRILILLYHKKLCVCEICGITGEPQPKISKHLAKLRDMGFVKDERQEQFIFYDLSLNEQVHKEILEKIVDNIRDYPELKSDIEKCKYAEKYIEVYKK